MSVLLEIILEMVFIETMKLIWPPTRDDKESEILPSVNRINVKKTNTKIITEKKPRIGKYQRIEKKRLTIMQNKYSHLTLTASETNLVKPKDTKKHSSMFTT